MSPETIYPLDARHSQMEFMRRFDALTMARKLARMADEPEAQIISSEKDKKDTEGDQ